MTFLEAKNTPTNYICKNYTVRLNIYFLRISMHMHEITS